MYLIAIIIVSITTVLLFLHLIFEFTSFMFFSIQ
jgi:hypothetical protein